MKKIIITLVGSLVIFLMTISLLSCGKKFAVVAYTRYIENNESQYIYYSADVYGYTHGQIEVYKDLDEFNSTFSIADLVFRFSKCLGADEIEGKKYTVVDLSKKTLYFQVEIYKESDLYSTDKAVYLNGEKLTPDSTFDGDTLLIYHYYKVNFTKSNPKGILDYSKTNTLEYK